MMNDDIVCTCMSVSVLDIRKAIESGAKSFDDVQQITGVASVCGVCQDDAQTIIERLLLEYHK